MNSLSGRYFDGRSPEASAATLIWGGRQASLIGERVSARYALDRLDVSPRIGDAARFVAFPDGGQLQCADDPALDALPHGNFSEGLVAWLEQRTAVAVAALVISVALLAAGYLAGLPWLAERVAPHLPPAVERQIGDEAVHWLDRSGWFTPSQLQPEVRTLLLQRFAEMTRGLPRQASYRLLFRRGGRIGANALAMPGGAIVLTDELVQLSKSPEEVLAVLAHEAGHVEGRHALRHLLQDSAVAATLAAVTADAATLSSAVAGLPVLLAQARYSREFEAEADEFAFALLARNGISPERFAEIMARLEQQHRGEPGASDFLASHPASPERIQRARAAAQGR